MAQKVTVIVEKGKGDKNFSCFVADELPGFGLAGYGRTAQEAIDDLYVAQKETSEILAERGETMPELEFTFKFDVGAFFDYYPLNISAFAKYIGMNAAQLRQYASAVKAPRQATLDKIHAGMKKFLADIGTVPLIEHPVISYP